MQLYTGTIMAIIQINEKQNTEKIFQKISSSGIQLVYWSTIIFQTVMVPWTYGIRNIIRRTKKFTITVRNETKHREI